MLLHPPWGELEGLKYTINVFPKRSDCGVSTCPATVASDCKDCEDSSDLTSEFADVSFVVDGFDPHAASDSVNAPINIILNIFFMIEL